MSTEVSEAIIEALQSITSTHLRQTRGLIYPWLDAAHDLVKNISHIQAVFDLLSDNESRLTYLWFLKFRLAGYISQSREFAHQAVPQLISEASWSEMLRLSETIPEKELEGHLPVDVIENYILDGYNLTGVCGVERGDVVSDLGAYNGNSSIVFSRAAGTAGRVYAFEPNPTTQAMLEGNLLKASCENVEIVRAGASDTVTTLGFSQGGAASLFRDGGELKIPVTTVDAFVDERALATVNFIKFDIEGHELKAIEGDQQVPSQTCNQHLSPSL